MGKVLLLNFFYIQYGEAKLTTLMYIKGVNFASPYCIKMKKYTNLISVIDYVKHPNVLMMPRPCLERGQRLRLYDWDCCLTIEALLNVKNFDMNHFVLDWVTGSTHFEINWDVPNCCQLRTIMTNSGPNVG